MMVLSIVREIFRFSAKEIQPAIAKETAIVRMENVSVWKDSEVLIVIL